MVAGGWSWLQVTAGRRKKNTQKGLQRGGRKPTVAFGGQLVVSLASYGGANSGKTVDEGGGG
jgi:hypothetical protein